MLVDDSRKELGPLRETLLDSGYDVVEVSTSAVALLERVAASQPDVIIISSESPTRDTLEQLSFVSERQPRPIVLFTDDGEHATIQAALKAGVSAYVVAGMQPERLKPILDVAVARFEQERRLRDELKTAQDRLAARKLIERAKGILMTQKQLSEADAFHFMRKLAMDRNRSLAEIAQRVIEASEILG